MDVKNIIVSIIGIFICISIIVFFNCRPQKDMARQMKSDDFAVIEYDSCEYVIRNSYHRGFLAHKGNCKYCEKRRQIKKEDFKNLMKE